MALKPGVIFNWLFILLVAAAVGFMVFSFSQPWWAAKLDTLEEASIYGWGFRHNLDAFMSGYVDGDVTPTWQVALAWVYVGISGIVALLGAWIRKWWGALLVGLAGLGYIAYAYTALNVVISDRLAEIGIAMEGRTMIREFIFVNSAIQPGHEMAYIAGGMLVALAVIKAVAAFFTRSKA